MGYKNKFKRIHKGNIIALSYSQLSNGNGAHGSGVTWKCGNGVCGNGEMGSNLDFRHLGDHG